jgi:hypothetical protein
MEHRQTGEGQDFYNQKSCPFHGLKLPLSAENIHLPSISKDKPDEVALHFSRVRPSRRQELSAMAGEFKEALNEFANYTINVLKAAIKTGVGNHIPIRPLKIGSYSEVINNERIVFLEEQGSRKLKFQLATSYLDDFTRAPIPNSDIEMHQRLICGLSDSKKLLQYLLDRSYVLNSEYRQKAQQFDKKHALFLATGFTGSIHETLRDTIETYFQVFSLITFYAKSEREAISTLYKVADKPNKGLSSLGILALATSGFYPKQTSLGIVPYMVDKDGKVRKSFARYLSSITATGCPVKNSDSFTELGYLFLENITFPKSLDGRFLPNVNYTISSTKFSGVELSEEKLFQYIAYTCSRLGEMLLELPGSSIPVPKANIKDYPESAIVDKAKLRKLFKGMSIQLEERAQYIPSSTTRAPLPKDFTEDNLKLLCGLICTKHKMLLCLDMLYTEDKPYRDIVNVFSGDLHFFFKDRIETYFQLLSSIASGVTTVNAGLHSFKRLLEKNFSESSHLDTLANLAPDIYELQTRCGLIPKIIEDNGKVNPSYLSFIQLRKSSQSYVKQSSLSKLWSILEKGFDSLFIDSISIPQSIVLHTEPLILGRSADV